VVVVVLLVVLPLPLVGTFVVVFAFGSVGPAEAQNVDTSLSDADTTAAAAPGL